MGRTLYFANQAHYAKIMVTLLETDRQMKEVEGAFEHPYQLERLLLM